MDILIDVASKTLLQTARARSSIANGAGLGDVEPINLWLLEPKVPYDPAAPWQAAETTVGWELTLSGEVDGLRTVLASASAASAAAAVAHPTGGWNGWSVDLDVSGAELDAWLGTAASKTARLEITWISGSNRTSWVHNFPVHAMAGQLARRRFREYCFANVALDATGFAALALPSGTDFTILGNAYLITTETLPSAGGTAFVVSTGFSSDGITGTTEYNDSLTNDGSTRSQLTDNAGTPTAQGVSDTHVYAQVTTAASASLVGTIIIYGYEEPA